MKKLILFAAILFAGVSVVSAQKQNVNIDFQPITHKVVTQGIANKSASTNLTVQLNSIQSISVNTSNVTLAYTTVADYTNGVRSGFIPNHLEVYSTGAYDVEVNYSDATDNTYTNPEGGLKPSAMFESINIALQKNVKGTNATIYSKPLLTESAQIITSTSGDFGATFNVDYVGAANYMNSIKGGDERIYTASVNYSIIAK